MMNLKELWRLFFVFCLLLCSCNDYDGDWDSMEWTVENLSPQDITYNKSTHEIKVNSKGGRINLICKNYSGFWFDIPFESSEPSYNNYKGEWYDLTINKNVMECKFDSKGSEVVNDTLYVPVTAGDIFFRFKIIRI